MKRRDAWRAIESARIDVDRMVASAVGDYPDRAPVRPSMGPSSSPSSPSSGPPPVPFREPVWQDPGARPRAVTEVPTVAPGPDANAVRTPSVTDAERRVLAELHQRVEARITALSQLLQVEPGYEHAIMALVLSFDERIMARLPDYLRLSWPLLQTKRTGSNTGGADFYRFAQAALATVGTPSFVFEVYYSCLANGFVGRYANDLVSLERQQQQLREAIELPRVSTEIHDTAEVSTRAAKPMPASVIYVLSLAVVVLVTASLTLLSNA